MPRAEAEIAFALDGDRADMFSARLSHGAARNRLTVVLEQRRAANLPIVDLTLSNPTRARFDYPSRLLTPLGHERGLRYDPMPFGLPDARNAVSEDFTRRGSDVPPERIVLTASTSEGYSLLFKLLCDPGDAVLAPRPCYPLVEHLTDLDAVVLESYALEFHGAWSIDLDGLRATLASANSRGRRVRAIIIISPNNPTGSVLTPKDARAVGALARDYNVALIVDEVFADYRFDNQPPAPIQDDVLAFRLGGLSKTVGLPQMKLGWIAVSGPATLVDDAMERLETICDTYLSVSTPVQAAAADLLRDGAVIRKQIQSRVCRNLEQLTAVVAAHPACSLLRPDGGWYAVVQVPAIVSEEALVIGLLDRAGILVHPGYFFDFDREAYIVVSLLPEPTIFHAAVEQLFREIGCS